MTTLPKVIYRFNAIPIKLLMAFFHRTRTKISLFVWKHKRSWTTKATLRKKNRAREINFPEFRLYYKASHQGRMVNPRTYGHLSFDKWCKNIQWRKDSLFNKWCPENGTATRKRMKLEHLLTPYTKINPKWVKDLHIRPETTKLFKSKTQAGHSLTQFTARSFWPTS